MICKHYKELKIQKNEFEFTIQYCLKCDKEVKCNGLKEECKCNNGFEIDQNCYSVDIKYLDDGRKVYYYYKGDKLIDRVVV